MLETDNSVIDESQASDFDFETGLEEETTEESAVEESQSDGSADVQDSSVEAQTIPYDRFKEVNERLKAAESTNQQLLALLSNPQQQAQDQQQPKQSGMNLNFDDESFISGREMKQILTQFENEIRSSINNTIQTQTESAAQVAIERQEAVFRQTSPDYDEVVKYIPRDMLPGLFSSHRHDPEKLVKQAYAIGKAYAPIKATAAQVVQQAKSQQKPPEKKTPTLSNEIKGGAVGTNMNDDKFDEWFNKL